MKLSVGIITFNEENRIGKTLDSVRGIADEIIVVDSESSDRTVEIALSKGAKVFSEKWKGYGPQKNFVLEKCKGEWILLIDADEVISQQLKEKIKSIINSDNPSKDVYKIKLRNIAFKKEIKFGGWDDYVIRLWKNGKVKISDREVHEQYQTESKIGKINEMIIHYTYDSIEEFLEKLNRYTSQSAKEYIKKGKNPSFIKIYSKMLFRFIKMYILQLGFLDGYEGYLLAKYSSIYTMTKYTKLREEYYNNLGNDTSLVITTYNWPKALEVCLNSALEQTAPPKEIIIADDGSKQETINLVKRFQQSYPNNNIIHSWQEDKGFRAGMSRNRAISKANGNYIIIIDGDLILNRHFVEDHIKNMERGCFIQGSRVITSPTVAQKMMEGKKINLFTKGLKNNMNMVRSKLLSKIFTKVDKNLRGIRSCNMSFFKEDLIRVNGFEEEIEGWGREDSELAVRLFNIGCKKKKLKFEALTCHLYHNENDRSRLKKNDEYLANAIKNKKTKAKKGLDRYEGSNAGNN
ncbi:glycosyltransferase [Leptotrichia trevisanii]|uniref:glycosyltransferase family 2 protein n=1 Tax=Leptotrichia trevisanii TaxID=109328 RepID=UPI0026F250CC|nr:glycosyltransferase [Leptotrichia trevisanii]